MLHQFYFGTELDNWVQYDDNGRKTKTLVGDFAVDLSNGTEYIFVYIDIIYHQTVGDTKNKHFKNH